MTLPTPYYEADGITIYCGDCRDILPRLGPVDLVLTDPPYFRVLNEAWDKAWKDSADFLVWLKGIAELLADKLQDNGTMYTFASPQMSARVECVISEVSNVIASCVWDKGQERLGAAGSGIDVTSLRTYWASGSERCIVSEKKPTRYDDADKAARDACGYWDACKSTKRSVFGDYLKHEFELSGVSRKQIAELFPSKTGKPTGCVSNWILGHNCPTKDQYQSMRRFLNSQGGEYLRTEYEYLRTEYEDLRRPFFLNKQHQWGDVWRWNVERSERSHPAQKPIGLIRQLVEVSSREYSAILDPFMGSGTTLVAAKQLGRRAIGIEIEERYCAIAVQRLRQRVLDFNQDQK